MLKVIQTNPETRPDLFKVHVDSEPSTTIINEDGSTEVIPGKKIYESFVKMDVTEGISLRKKCADGLQDLHVKKDKIYLYQIDEVDGKATQVADLEVYMEYLDWADKGKWVKKKFDTDPSIVMSGYGIVSYVVEDNEARLEVHIDWNTGKQTYRFRMNGYRIRGGISLNVDDEDKVKFNDDDYKGAKKEEKLDKNKTVTYEDAGVANFLEVDPYLGMTETASTITVETPGDTVTWTVATASASVYEATPTRVWIHENSNEWFIYPKLMLRFFSSATTGMSGNLYSAQEITTYWDWYPLDSTVNGLASWYTERFSDHTFDGSCRFGAFINDIKHSEYYNGWAGDGAIHFDPALGMSTKPAAGAEVLHASGVNWGTGLVASWLFNEGSGTTVNDRSGNGITGTMVNTPTWINHSDGSPLWVYFSTASDEYVSCGTGNLGGITDQMTVVMRVRVTLDVSGAILSKHAASPNYGFVIKRSATNDTIEFGISTTGSNWTSGNTASNSCEIDTWYTIVCTYDGAYMRVFIDGDEETGGSYPLACTGDINMGSQAIQIMRDALTGVELDGDLECLHVYSRCLTLTEIKSISLNPYLPYAVAASAIGSINIDWDNDRPDPSMQIHDAEIYTSGKTGHLLFRDMMDDLTDGHSPMVGNVAVSVDGSPTLNIAKRGYGTLFDSTGEVFSFLTGYWQQDDSSDHLVVIDANEFTDKRAYNSQEWLQFSTVSGYTGQGYVMVDTTGTNIATGFAPLGSPRLDYLVNFTQTGDHYIWIRFNGNGSDDSIHMGIDFQAVSTATKITREDSTGEWKWTNTYQDTVFAAAKINVATTGLHWVNVWMREDGTILDKIVLTTNSSYTITDNTTNTGPAFSSVVQNGVFDPLKGTIICEFKSAGAGSDYERIFACPNDRMFHLKRNNSDTGMYFRYGYDDRSWVTPNVWDTEWHTIMLTWDYTNADFSLTIDGVCCEFADTSITPVNPIITKFGIGSQSIDYRDANGVVRDFRIYDCVIKPYGPPFITNDSDGSDYRSDVVFRWAMEDVADTSPEVGGVTLTKVGSPTNATGKEGGGITFTDGNCFHYPLTSLPFPKDGTVSFWYKNTSTCSVAGKFIAHGTSDGLLQWCRATTDYTFRIQMGNGGTNYYIHTVTTNVFDGNWHFLKLVHSVTNSISQVWIDGVKESEDTGTTLLDTDFANGTLYIGDRSDNTRGICGIIDSFQITDDYTSIIAKPGYDLAHKTVTAYIKGDEADGDRLKVGNGVIDVANATPSSDGFLLDGSSDIVSIPTASTINLSTGQITFWWKSSTTTPAAITAKWFCSATNDAYLQLFRHSTVLTTMLFDVGGVETSFTVPNLYDQKWHFFCCKWDASTNWRFVSIDGITYLDVTSPTFSAPSFSPLYIGNRADGARYIEGYIKDFTITNNPNTPLNWTVGGEPRQLPALDFTNWSADHLGFAHEDNGTPDDTGTSYVAYGVAGDRTYCRKHTATEDGAIDSINIRLHMSMDMWTHAWLVVYVNNVLVGVSDEILTGSITSTGWQGYKRINAVDGQTLAFESGDEIHFGIAWEFGSNSSMQIYRDENVTGEDHWEYSSQALSGEPLSSCTWTASTIEGQAIILRYRVPV